MNTKSKLVIASVITAAAAGAIWGLLYTEEGRKIQKSAKCEAEKLRKQAEKQAKRLRAQGEDLKNEMVHRYEKGKGRWQKKLKSANDSMHSNIESGIENTLS